MLVLGLGYLLDFMQVRTTVVEHWPGVGAPLPLVALVCTVIGLILSVTGGWRWYAPRRPSERFRRLVPDIQELTRQRRRDPIARVGLSDLSHRARTASKLLALGVGVPDGEENLRMLLVLAEQRRLKEARIAFPRPIPEKVQGPHAAPR